MIRRNTIPFGPQHPVLPEPIQLRLVMEDEKIVEALPVVGYVHRGLEKIAEKKDYVQDVYLAERICGICSFMHSQNYCQGIESLMNVSIPERAKYLRVVWAELHRIHSHLLILGLLADAFGFENLFMRLWQIRELILDVMEKTTGARVILGACCIGGVRRDITPELRDEVLRQLAEVEKQLKDVVPALTDDYSVKQRLVGVGVLPKDKAYELGAVGPVARASGVHMDLRETGYAAYGALDVKVATESDGDCYARTLVRVRELYTSADLVRQALQKMPEGPIAVPVKGNPSGEVLARIEQPRGELNFYFRGNGTRNLDRFRVRTPTFANLPALLHMLTGCQLADVPVIAICIDPCISCTER
jgi:Ni,Fe-hydrogenase III large subunit